MKKNKLNPIKALALFAVVFGLVFITSCGDDEDPGPDQTVYEILSEEDDLSSLKSLLDAQGLSTQLQGDGEVTLFAPSNDALTALLTTLGLTSFDPVAEDIKMAVLAYHISLSGKYSADALPASVATVQGESIEVTSGGMLASGASTDANITQSIEATNGYVHIVDAVLVPPTIGAVIVATLGTAAQPVLLSSSFSNLADAILKADAGKAASETIVGALIQLSGSGVTVFAPVNQALSADLVSSTSATELDALIRNHIVVGNVNPLADGDDYTTLGGGTVSIAAAGTVNQVPIITDQAVVSTNWTVYPIGGVIQ